MHARYNIIHCIVYGIGHCIVCYVLHHAVSIGKRYSSIMNLLSWLTNPQSCSVESNDRILTFYFDTHHCL